MTLIILALALIDVPQPATAFPIHVQPDLRLTAGMKPMEIKIVDINYDGLPDLLTVNDDGNDVSFFYQRTDKTYNAVPDFSLYIGETPTSAAVEDLNRDGLLDLMVVDNGCFFPTLNCNMTIFYQRPDYSYPLVPDQTVGRRDIPPWQLAVADYNSDGLLDAAMSGGVNGGVFVFLQLASGGFQNAPDMILKTPGVATFGLLGVDLNSDGLDDLAVANYLSSSISLFYQRHEHTLPLFPDLNLSSGDGPILITPGDLNGDGLVDLVVTNGKEHTLSLFYQRRNYTFPASPDVKIATGGTGLFAPMHSAIGDLNDDGLDDIVVTRLSGGLASVYLQLPGGTFPSSPSFDLDAEASCEVAIGDLNGDGLNDIAMATYPVPPAEDVYIFYQEPSGLHPLTSLSVGEPRVDGALTLVTSSTPISFDAVDRSGAGIAATYYRINGGPWQTYQKGFMLNLFVEGVNTLDFYSVDNSSTVEPAKTKLLAVDNTPPATTVSMGNPHFQSSDLWISPLTNVSLSAVDGPSSAAGVNITTYRTWNLSGWSPWYAYSGSFTLIAEGMDFVEFRSDDLLGNTEATKNVSMTVDGSPPTSFISAPFIANGSRALSFAAMDAGVGVSSTRFSVDGGPWRDYSNVVYLPGDADHRVLYSSEDLLGNVEPVRIAFFQKSSVGPLTSLQAGSPSFGSLPIFVTSSTPLYLLAQDQSGSGTNRTVYNVDGGPWRDYSTSFTLGGEGAHEVGYYSVDNLGQQGSTEMSMLVVDDTGPDAILIDGGGAHVTRDGKRFAAHSSTFILDAKEGGVLPVGLDSVTYQLWTALGWSPWTSFSSPFPFGQPEGVRWVRYYATDLLGNSGVARNESVVVDDTPPVSTLTIGQPYHEGAQRFVTSFTPFSFISSDAGALHVGLNATLFRTWNQGWTQWAECRSTFHLTGEDGVRYVEFYSVDLLGNEETQRNVTLMLDNTPPATTIEPVAGEFTTDTILTLLATDGGSGVNRTEYRIDGGEWTRYTFGFTLSEGEHVIHFHSIDNLGNTEAERTRAMSVRESPSQVEVNYKPLVALAFSIALMLFGLWSAKKRPWKGGKNGTGAVKAFMIVSMPFVLAEVATGVLSLSLESLRIPPIFGLGMGVDCTVLAVGLVAMIARLAWKRENEEEMSSG
jgi:hypothetical protein